MNGVRHSYYDRFPPSPACSCHQCRAFCSRPCWPLIEEASEAIVAGLASCLMVAFSPDLSYGILSPAFRGNESHHALQVFASAGCTFLNQSGCKIFDTHYRPLECRYCHHDRMGLGLSCHLSIAKNWNISKGKRTVHHWLEMVELPYPKQRFILDMKES